jgi:hypothetical protein
VTVNFFGVLGVRPWQGRLFDQADARPDATSTAVVSLAFATREFGSAQAAIGQTISLRTPFTVIGVLPPGFHYMTPADVYLLLEPQVAANYRTMRNRSSHTGLYAVGRLKPGADVTAARAEMQNIVAALALDHPDTNKGSGVYIVPLADRVVRDMAPTLTVLAGAVALLLLIACVNLASLLLNRSASRAHEFGVRAAIGGAGGPDTSAAHRTRCWSGPVACLHWPARDPTGLIGVRPGYTAPRRDPASTSSCCLRDALQLCLCVPVRRAARTAGVRPGPRTMLRSGAARPAELAGAPPCSLGSGCRDGAALGSD